MQKALADKTDDGGADRMAVIHLRSTSHRMPDSTRLEHTRLMFPDEILGAILKSEQAWNGMEGICD
jgi:hypothetical protein